MSKAWHKGVLRDVCRVIPGYAFKSRDWRNEGVPVVKIKNIREDSTVDISEADYVAEDLITPKLQKYILHDGDILVAMTGATAGKVGRIRTNRKVLLNQRVAKICPVKADKDFIWAVVSSHEYQQKFYNLAFEGVEIPLPPDSIQKRIASILSAYDELIENSQRRIKILEEMARALYREWFVEFRFPGHESIPRVQSPLGEIPKGWEVTTLGRLIEIKKGKNITKDTIRNGTVPVVAGGLAPAYFHDVPNTRSPVITISASGANAGFVNLYYLDVWASDCSYIDFSATPHVFYFYLWLDHRRAAITHLQRGSAQPHVYPKDLALLEALRPPKGCLDAFTSLVDPIFEMIMRLTAQVENLRRTRDLLLPRILSGEIEIGDN